MSWHRAESANSPISEDDLEIASAVLQHMSVSHEHYLYDNYLIEATVSNINPMNSFSSENQNRFTNIKVNQSQNSTLMTSKPNNYKKSVSSLNKITKCNFSYLHIYWNI